jgi:tetratricopeptide (TPR) repeat protein
LRIYAENGDLVVEFNPYKTVSNERLPFDETYLREKLNYDPNDWDSRLRLADGLFEKEVYAEAAEIIWNGRIIPSEDLDLALSIRILSKAQPRKAIRLLTAVLELNQGKPAHNMAMANAMLHFGMVLQAIRFYGAALEVDPSLVNPDIESLILWSDDKSTMGGLFEKKLPKLGKLPRLVRDPKEALDLSSRISLHDIPVYLPDLPVTAGEEFKHDLHQSDFSQDKIIPPTPISVSSVPTSILRVKWSTLPTPTEDTAIPVTAPPVAPFEAAAPEPPTPGPRKLNIPGR